MLVFVFHDFENLIYDDADGNRNNEEEQGVENCVRNSRARNALPDDDGENDQADDVVQNRRRQNGSADFAVKLAEFFEGGHGERYAGGRQNDAVVKVLNHLFAVADSSEQAGRAEAQSHRHDYAQKSDDDGRFAGRANPLEVGFETCGKHYENHADLGYAGKQIAVAHPAQKVRPQNKPRKKRAYNFGKLELAHNKPQRF